MSLLDLNVRCRKAISGLMTALAVAGLLAGCQVRPLYGSLDTPSGADSTVQAELAAIEIDPISDKHSDDDAARELYNELTFNFEGGGASPRKLYRLKVLMDISQAAVGVEELADVPSAYTLTMNTTFVLSDYETQKTLTTGRSFATASYDFSSQRFANIRAKRDAKQRAAATVADDIQARIAGYFASQR
ncbi:LPS assembly lipoprotein LptE [Roseibium polysiphoniae]|uniref:LPS assembly lipoprotein LptE n=1 Tax=Roseibium polysiphoniae TaxID=2571221 RepID=UPI00329794CF